MDYNYAPVQPPVNNAPVQPPVSQPIYKPLSLKNMIYMDTYTCVSALALFVTYVIVVTRFRVWHTNKFLRKIIKVASHPVNNMINQAIGFIVTFSFPNDLYLIWIVILLIAYDNVFTVSQYSLFEEAAYRRLREYGFLYSCTFTLIFIIIYKQESKFYIPLLVLLALVILKFLIRITSFVFAERAYGLENVNLVADYMKKEHTLTNAIDPKYLKGYKYFVRGEEKIKTTIRAPDYSLEVELKDPVVTVERVWSCNEGLLHPSVDEDGGLKDVCLSFALFKLLRRKLFDYPAADQAERTKTRRLIFDGFLSQNANAIDDSKVDKKRRVFRVIKTELGFLRDLIFTRYPVGFAFGFPVLNSLVLGGTVGVTLWIAVKAVKEHRSSKTPGYFLIVGDTNIDYPITYILLILVTLMELFEVLMYVFCDWTKVIMVCQNVKCNSSHVTDHFAIPDARWYSCGYKALAYVSKLSFSGSVKTKLGQYSLFSNCKTKCGRSLSQLYYRIINCIVSKTEVSPPGFKKIKSVELTKDGEVVEAIFDTLAASGGDLRNGMSAMQRNGVNIYQDLPWARNLRTPVHIIMVWHIATTLCEMHQKSVEGGNESSNHSDKKVSIHLSQYCAYLVAFHPDLLSIASTKYIFWKIAEETSAFLDGVSNSDTAMYGRMMSYRDGSEEIINRATVVGRYLIDNISDDARRWKILADFWSELILSLAPAGSARAHLEQLGNGSEFITHLWALLYHAGLDTMNSEYHP